VGISEPDQTVWCLLFISSGRLSISGKREMNFVDEGIKWCNQATEHDNSGRFTEACRCYTTGVEYLLTGLKHLPNDFIEIKDKVRLNVKSYLARAEEIKRSINPPAPDKINSSGPGGGGAVASASKVDPQGKSGGPSASSSADGSPFSKLILSALIPAGKLTATWDDVAGHPQCKAKLQQTVILPITQPQVFSPGSIAKGVLLYGPPGTGKTELARAAAAQSKCSFFVITSAIISNKFVGESEKIVTALFEEAARNAPAIIFIDEIDSVLKQRMDGGSGQVDHTDQAKTQFFVCWDGLLSTAGILVLGATNLPWALDNAALRRFSKKIYIPLPDKNDRKKIFEIHLKKSGKEQLLTAEQIEALALVTEGYSGSDIKNVVNSALAKPLDCVISATHFMIYRTSLDNEGYYGPCLPSEPGAIEMTYDKVPPGRLANVDCNFEDFQDALKEVKGSVGDKGLKRYEEWTKEFGQEG
jgi:vacuolar protein-sorting-associated protein 4